MPLVSKRRLAWTLRTDRSTIDRYMRDFPDFPIAAHGGQGNTAWQFDPEVVRDFISTKRAERDKALEARRMAAQAMQIDDLQHVLRSQR